MLKRKSSSSSYRFDLISSEMEEFEEFDVLFSENPQLMKVYPDSDSRLQNNKHSSSKDQEEEKKRRKKKKKKKLMSISVPIRIPILTSGNSILNRMESGDYYDIFEEEEEEEETEETEERRSWRMVPPHLMVDRRSRPATSRRMAFSVCTGNGRTLKGRDLSQVRNSVLRMTGFIETC